jgi:hypothetical protein
MAANDDYKADYEGLLENYRNAWLGLPGALLSEDGVLRKYGPEPIHEAQAIVDALIKILSEPRAGSNRGRGTAPTISVAANTKPRPGGEPSGAKGLKDLGA